MGFAETCPCVGTQEVPVYCHPADISAKDGMVFSYWDIAAVLVPLSTSRNPMSLPAVARLPLGHRGPVS
jgi:hypothetical protein